MIEARDASYLLEEEFGGHYNADVFCHFAPETLPETAMDSAGRLGGRAEEEDVPIVVALLAAIRDDRPHPLLDELGVLTAEMTKLTFTRIAAIASRASSPSRASRTSSRGGCSSRSSGRCAGAVISSVA